MTYPANCKMNPGRKMIWDTRNRGQQKAPQNSKNRIKIVENASVKLNIVKNRFLTRVKDLLFHLGLIKEE